ncbi:hypothetical protein MMC06_005191, partial [Schaereria dolodes]|nr:hypothetical protein [Schaereria dolodes]
MHLASIHQVLVTLYIYFIVAEIVLTGSTDTSLARTLSPPAPALSSLAPASSSPPLSSTCSLFCANLHFSSQCASPARSLPVAGAAFPWRGPRPRLWCAPNPLSNTLIVTKDTYLGLHRTLEQCLDIAYTYILNHQGEPIPKKCSSLYQHFVPNFCRASFLIFTPTTVLFVEAAIDEELTWEILDGVVGALTTGLRRYGWMSVDFEVYEAETNVASGWIREEL